MMRVAGSVSMAKTQIVKRTTILVNPLLWKKFRIRALQKNKTAKELLEELICEELKEMIK